MKTITSCAAVLAAGMALAPMTASAANVPTIAFAGGSDQGIGYSGGRIGGFMGIDFVTGLDTPRNEGESRVCDPLAHSIRCSLSFSTDAAYVGGGTYQGKGGGGLTIFDDATFMPLLTATFADVTVNVDAIGSSVNGTLKDVVIDEDLAAYYGVANRGTGEMDVAAGLQDFDPDFPEQGFHGRSPQGGVTFSPVPVPAALPLMLTALGGLGLIRLRRTQTA